MQGLGLAEAAADAKPGAFLSSVWLGMKEWKRKHKKLDDLEIVQQLLYRFIPSFLANRM